MGKVGKRWKMCNSRCGLTWRRYIYIYIYFFFFFNREKKSLKREKKILKING